MTTCNADHGIQFEKVSGHIGAHVHGAALQTEPDSAVAHRLRMALHEYGVLFFQFDEVPDSDAFNRFSEVFGALDARDQTSVDQGLEPCIDEALTPMVKYQNNRWHANSTALACPPRAAMLTPLELPSSGGDTMWASMSAAWEALSPRYQAMIEGMEVLHSTARKGPAPNAPKTVHPAVLHDPITRRKMLYVNSNYAEWIVGMHPRESETLLQMLFEHINTPEFHVRIRWRLGLVAVWDERGTQHRGVADFDGPRKLRRLTFQGDQP